MVARVSAVNASTLRDTSESSILPLEENDKKYQ